MGRSGERGARRVVVTGVGVVAPGGIGTKQFWDLLTAGRTATRTISLFDATRDTFQMHEIDPSLDSFESEFRQEVAA